ncbi:hypothetical protein [Micromonospora carbonacea]|uniref:hypothetical protein n=1 Tax=Micromonospora carbonacea TaxID=47853 RepID=UPI00159F2386|nr:hypothetical protein [Micromonospora carbonacea]
MAPTAAQECGRPADSSVAILSEFIDRLFRIAFAARGKNVFGIAGIAIPVD